MSGNGGERRQATKARERSSFLPFDFLLLPSAGRRAVNTLIRTLTAACAFLGVVVLLLILGYIAWRGVSSLSLQFLIDTPKPVGEGGGIGSGLHAPLVILQQTAI